MESAPNRLPFQFALWRLLAAVSCFGLSGGTLRYAIHEIDTYGGGFYPILLLVFAAISLVVGIWLIFPRVIEAALKGVLYVLSLFDGW
ncbi:MAG: hypothetical protein AB7O68_16575 [Pirellulales bacterium]